MLELRQTHPRRQGDIGEAAAIAWLTRAGFGVWVPLGHSADADLIAERDRRLFRIPAAAIEARTMLLLGGPKYAAFEVDGASSAPMGERGFEPL